MSLSLTRAGEWLDDLVSDVLRAAKRRECAKQGHDWWQLTVNRHCRRCRLILPIEGA